MPSLLVANRGEIAVRIMGTAAGLGFRTVAVYPADDADCAHVTRADHAERLDGSYLDAAAIVAAAKRTGCEFLHPGYGFLSESPGSPAAAPRPAFRRDRARGASRAPAKAFARSGHRAHRVHCVPWSGHCGVPGRRR